MGEIIFLGTGGARVVVFKQVRASGGIWMNLDGTQLLIDPGPGSLVRCLSNKAKLDPTKLDGILLSHKHLDHSGDINTMMEAMSEGGFKKRGIVFAPQDALDDDPVILKYVRSYVNEIQILKEGGDYSLGNIRFTTPLRHIHGNAETYGVVFEALGKTISYIVDTRFFPELIEAYRGDLLILHVVRLKPSPYDHLCIEDAKKIIEGIKPKVAILTHFGMTVLRAKPWEIADQMSKETGVKVYSAYDGMRFDLQKMEPIPQRIRKSLTTIP